MRPTAAPRLALALLACALAPALSAQERMAFVGARLWDGTGAPAVADAVLVVEGGRVRAVGPRASTPVPRGFTTVDLAGRFVIPGLINAHGHVGSARGLESGPSVYTREVVLDQLRLNARYGITTVVSLGGDGPAGPVIRKEEGPDLDRARLRVAGPVLDPDTPGEARAQVNELAAYGSDWVKIRVDGSPETKMTPDVYAAVAAASDEHRIPLAAHLVTLEDAKGLVRSGTDLLAHSVRDAPVDRELIDLMKARDVCLVPTLMREVSVFAYAERPAFFDDPFFKAEVDPGVLTQLAEPERMARVAASPNTRNVRDQWLPMAMRNLKLLSDAGVGIAMGTDSGQAGRFQGYFEHVELERMAEAGLSPERVLRAATGEAARCMRLQGVGTLTTGTWADFVVLTADPLAEVRNSRAIDAVYVAGNRVPGR
jgi:imidazolonepropionase-like amidohydrolase